MNVYIGGAKSDYSAMRGPAPSGFHVPTREELIGIESIMTQLNIVTGGKWSNYLHLPLSGFRYFENGNIMFQGGGYYRLSTPRTQASTLSSYYMGLNQNYEVGIYDFNYSSCGMHIRAFKDTYVAPDSSWTVIQGTLGGAGIFWNQSEGLISITSDGTTGYTIQDKNLGATTVYNDGDTLTQANMGNMYQRGNNYGFPSTGSVTTSSTQVNAQNYGPGNYYSGSTFITRSSSPYSWDSSNNNNLRGGETGVVMVPAELKNAYIGEYVPPYLCFTANTSNSTIQLKQTGTPTAVTLETSTDGLDWTTYTIGDTITLSNIGDKVYWRNTSETDTGFSTDAGSNIYRFYMTGSISASGDINYLLNKNSTLTVSSYCFCYLFYYCDSLTTAPKIPATTLAYRCYLNMFKHCYNLKQAPKILPATTLAEQCYSSMFAECRSLVVAPELPATTLANYCYSSMFRDCTSLTNAPVLPATTLANYCYSDMLRGCTSLTTPPQLLATTLSTYCYKTMFLGCTNLEGLPKLPATTLASNCYAYMFYQCSKIKLSTTQTGEYQTPYRIPTTGTGTTATDALIDMFTSTGGTFTGTPSINTTYYTSNTVV